MLPLLLTLALASAPPCDPHREGQPFLLTLDQIADDPGVSWVNLWIDGIKHPLRARSQFVNGEARWEFREGLTRGRHTIKAVAYTSDGDASEPLLETIDVLPPLFQ